MALVSSPAAVAARRALPSALGRPLAPRYNLRLRHQTASMLHAPFSAADGDGSAHEADRKPRVLILGSGWAGFTLARRLDKSLFDVVSLERVR